MSDALNPTPRVQGSSSGNKYDAVFTDKKDNSTLGQMDFMKLMISQMQNQDFTNPMDNSDMINQMAQFSNMQQMQDMAAYSKTNYAMSLVGKNVTASRFSTNGQLETSTGPVEKVSFVDNEYIVYVGGKRYTLEQVMSAQAPDDKNNTTIDPANYPLTINDVKTDRATINWKVPTEDTLVAAGLKYTVYYSTNKDFSTVEEIEGGTLVGVKEQKNITSTEIAGLSPDTQYYANVVVTDASGKKSVYKTVPFHTHF